MISSENVSPFLEKALKDNYVNFTGEAGKRILLPTCQKPMEKCRNIDFTEELGMT